ncbi:MAG: hypothetical protein JWO94_3001 [Verrucomicrobiaceae bacterium]|nr:hypothetical protein [Verrucomicrobiaceae bacterium]
MSQNPFSWYGFRFFATDALVLAAGTAGSWALWRQEFPLWWMVPCVVGHFFLFCNVFRVRRSYELVWAAAFLVNMGWWLSQGSLGWNPALLAQFPVTLIVLLAELRSPRYHGIFARRINPKLDAYLASKAAG